MEKLSGIVTCSALKHMYRDILRTGDGHGLSSNENQITHQTQESRVSDQSEMIQSSKEHENCTGIIKVQDKVLDMQDEVLDLVFVHLTGSEEVLRARLEGRRGHFMPPALLTSQLATLEPLTPREIGFTVNIDATTDSVVIEIMDRFKQMS